MSLFWSLHLSKKYFGRAYWDTRSGHIFIANIFEWCSSYQEFLTYLQDTMLHEYLHLFLKFVLGKWYCSEKTVIHPLVDALLKVLSKDRDWSERVYLDFIDLKKHFVIRPLQSSLTKVLPFSRKRIVRRKCMHGLWCDIRKGDPVICQECLRIHGINQKTLTEFQEKAVN